MSVGDDSKNKPKPFKQGQPTDKPKLKEMSEVEAKLAKLEAEVSAKAELNAPLAHANVPEPVAPPAESAAPARPAKASKASAEGAEHSPHVNMIAFWAIALLSIFIANVPYVDLLLTPVTQFVTMIHEGSHALVALLTGGHPTFTIVPDGLGHGGLTKPNGGWLFFSAQAGYLGTAMFGCFLIWLGQFTKYSRHILMGIGSMMLLSTLIFIVPGIFSVTFLSSLLSAMWGIFMGASCIYMGKKLKPFWANLVVLFLAVQTALSSISLAWILIPHALHLAGEGFSDATIMAQYFVLPAVFWAFLWIAMSIAMLYFTLKFTYGKAILNRKNIQKKL
ncbi:MAG: M50 family metallopeptidase [Cyanobacteria bacterium SZAS TMP-1]|nr:M50 family metallopeptidase [Cyanobacteria bacterium SZAS TMP-1]